MSGFALLILLTAVLGALAVVNMRRTETEAKQLADWKVPQVRMANDVERSTHLTMYQMRGYGDTEQTNFLQAGLQNIDDAKKHIAEAKQLGARSPLLAGLKAAAEKEEAEIQLYEQYVRETVAKNEGLQQDRKELDRAGQEFTEDCARYFDSENGKLLAQIQTNAPADALLKRYHKIVLINEVIDTGNAVRIAVWRAQAERDPQQLVSSQTNFALIKAKLEELRPITTQTADLRQLDGCQASADAYKSGMNDLSSKWQARDETGKVRLATGIELLSEAQDGATGGLQDTADTAGRAAALMSSATVIIGVGLAVAMVIGLALASVMTRSTNRVLNRLTDSLNDSSNQVASAAGQVSSASQTLAEGAGEQASSLEEASASLEEMSSMTKRNAENARKANGIAKQAHEAADKGVGDMHTMSLAMEAIKVSSDDIAKIIKTIDEIAFQTNLLALNAAVEAARAGEAGMGFAVVAEEVRNLAQRCAQAAKETSGKIEGAITKTGQGVEISAKVAAALNDIVSKVREVDDLVSAVASASSEQTDGITQINSAVGQMDKVTQGNAASAEESAAAAQELDAQAAVMKQSVAELQQLVGGGSASGEPPVVSSRSPHKIHPTPVRKLALANVPSKANGHAPATAAAARQASEIPLAGDFKDF